MGAGAGPTAEVDLFRPCCAPELGEVVTGGEVEAMGAGAGVTAGTGVKPVNPRPNVLLPPAPTTPLPMAPKPPFKLLGGESYSSLAPIEVGEKPKALNEVSGEVGGDESAKPERQLPAREALELLRLRSPFQLTLPPPGLANSSSCNVQAPSCPCPEGTRMTMGSNSTSTLPAPAPEPE